MNLVRALRGVLATSAMWAAAWTPFALIPIGLLAIRGLLPPSDFVVMMLVNQATVGAVNGAAFAAALLIAGRRKRFEDLSRRWMALWGGVGGAVFPLFVQSSAVAEVGVPISAVVVGTVLSAALGASCAVSTLVLARRAPERIDGRARGLVGTGAA